MPILDPETKGIIKAEVIAIGSGQPAMGGRRVVRLIANMALLSHIRYHR